VIHGELRSLSIEERELRGELVLALEPGTVAGLRDRAIDRIVAAPLEAIAEAHGAVVAAAPSAFAHPRPGKDDEGRTVFDLRGHLEGDRLLPRRAGKRRA
jgi:hypothetical protein